MERATGTGSGALRFTATIPADYTDSPYPLLYSFRVHFDDGSAAPFPGFEPSLANQPYYLLRQAR